MGLCSSKEVEGTTKNLQAKQARDQALAVSKLIELHCISLPAIKLQVRELQTALEVLQMVAEKRGYPKELAKWCQMEFVESTVAHEHTMQQAGLCDAAQFCVLGVAEAKTRLNREAAAVDFMEAAEQGKTEDLQLVLAVFPEKVKSMDGYGSTALHYAAIHNHCEVAELLLTAGADPNAQGEVSAHCAQLYCG